MLMAQGLQTLLITQINVQIYLHSCKHIYTVNPKPSFSYKNANERKISLATKESSKVINIYWRHDNCRIYVFLL